MTCLIVCQLLAVVIYVPSVICGNVSLGNVEVKNISSVVCRSSVDIKIDFNRETDKKRHSIAECKKSEKTCYLMDQSFGKYYAVSFTGNETLYETLFYVLHDGEETRGTFTFYDIYSPADSVRLDINSLLSNVTKNNLEENNHAFAKVSPENPAAASAMIAIITILLGIICGLVIYILKLKKVCLCVSLSSFSSRDERIFGADVFRTVPTQPRPINQENSDTVREEPASEEAVRLLGEDVFRTVPELSSTMNTNSCHLNERISNTSIEQTNTAEELSRLEDEGWFHGVHQREDVQHLLSQDGDFLVLDNKKRTNEEQYVLLAYWREQREFIINMVENGWTIEGDVFATIQEMVNHHVETKKQVSTKCGTILLKPITRNAWQLNNDDFLLRQELYDGKVCDVFMATNKLSREIVAVKRCKNIHLEDQHKLLKEGRFLKQFEHPNIVKFIGIAAQKQPVMIIMEYVSGGSLHSFLREKGKHQTTIQKANMCLDVANGMVYLLEKGFIHRNLHSRNCLIDRVVKIADFGRITEKDDNTILNEPQQISYTAPEALQFVRYTTMCDVWSYGILMWVIFSNGLATYSGWTNQRIREEVTTGYRMSAPQNTPDSIYQQMIKCWDENPSTRISFQEMYTTMKHLTEHPPTGENWMVGF